MRTKKGFSLRKVGNENIIIATTEENVDFTNIISFNEPATRLWQAVEGKTFTPAELADHLMEWYDVDKETALNDANTLAEAWMEAGIIEE